jgi:hypothetical protein
MICPNCRTTHHDFELTCPDCHAPLVRRFAGMPDPRVESVPVFHTPDAGVLPLAELALQGEDIAYSVRRLSTDARRPYNVAVTDFNNPLDAAEIIVARDDAARARELLVDLEQSVPAPCGEVVAPPVVPRERRAAPRESSRSVQLSDAATGQPLGAISPADLGTLIDLLEEESETSRDYYIDAATIDMLADNGASETLVALLRSGLGPRPGLDIRWSRS